MDNPIRIGERHRPCWTADVVAAFILLAVAMKALDISPTVAVVQYVFGASYEMAIYLIACLLMIEVLIAVWLITRWRMVPATICCGVMLTGFIAVVLCLVRGGSTLPCGCGLPAIFSSARLAHYVAITRNLFLILLLGIAGLEARDIQRS